MTAEGVVVISASSFRTQDLNRKDARLRLVELVRRALVSPKKRKKTRPTKASKERRLSAKSRTSQLKASRGRVHTDHD